MDIRAQRSKKALREALLSLIKTRPLKDVSVTEVCATAGLNRTTFYKYYGDCEDILLEIEKEQLDDYRELMRSKDVFGEELISGILSQIEKGREINRTAGGSYFSGGFIDEMASIAKQYAFDSWQKRMPKATPQEVELALSTMISATLHVVVSEADRYDRDTVVRFISNMANGIVRMYE